MNRDEITSFLSGSKSVAQLGSEPRVPESCSNTPLTGPYNTCDWSPNLGQLHLQLTVRTEVNELQTCWRNKNSVGWKTTEVSSSFVSEWKQNFFPFLFLNRVPKKTGLCNWIVPPHQLWFLLASVDHTWQRGTEIPTNFVNTGSWVKRRELKWYFIAPANTIIDSHPNSGVLSLVTESGKSIFKNDLCSCTKSADSWECQGLFIVAWHVSSGLIIVFTDKFCHTELVPSDCNHQLLVFVLVTHWALPNTTAVSCEWPEGRGNKFHQRLPSLWFEDWRFQCCHSLKS